MALSCEVGCTSAIEICSASLVSLSRPFLELTKAYEVTRPLKTFRRRAIFCFVSNVNNLDTVLRRGGRRPRFSAGGALLTANQTWTRAGA